MKPMLALIAVGMILLGTMIFFGYKSFDGVTENKSYEAALKYNEAKADVHDLEKAFGTISSKRSEKELSIAFNFEPANTIYPDTVIEKASIGPLAKNANYPLIFSNGAYLYSGNIPQGWYILQLTCVTGNKEIVVRKSIYIE